MNNLTYEKAISRLEEIVEEMEKNELSLEESIKLYEEGTRLTAYCSDLLNKAQLKITELTKE
ncbi:MAG: exodeoxyribonuclease VII small subunit [Eubacterium sp.]|nr:exodeoxyribonuclease VII small subunit [Eubacterium sp.]